MARKAEVMLYVELVPSAKYPYVAPGRTWARKPKGATGPVVKLALQVPANIFEVLVNVSVDIPERPTDTTATAEWTS